MDLPLPRPRVWIYMGDYGGSTMEFARYLTRALAELGGKSNGQKPKTKTENLQDESKTEKPRRKPKTESNKQTNKQTASAGCCGFKQTNRHVWHPSSLIAIAAVAPLCPGMVSGEERAIAVVAAGGSILQEGVQLRFCHKYGAARRNEHIVGHYLTP